jgi:lysophospholipase L1-like esterase
MKIPAHAKLVMIGDSITDAGRKQPVGEGLFGGLGTGYVALVDGLLNSTYPERQIRVVNMGCSGNTVLSLRDRWQRDVIDKKPDWLSIMIGINDVWRQFDETLMTENFVTPDVYEKTLDELVSQTLPVTKNIVLLSPYYLEPNRQDAMRAQMDRYGKAVARIAKKHHLTFVDVQAAFEKVLANYYPAWLAWDRVHPHTVGHMTIARAFLDAVGYSWAGGK